MRILTNAYTATITNLPKTGQYILAHQTEKEIVVYQAYRDSIADFAVRNQYLGGPDFSYNRMSWIKPNFLWMMYRCGWGQKEGQQRILALWFYKTDFEKILQQAVFSSFHSTYYENHDHWRNELNEKEVRLQWDPDHDPYGNKLERRAIQLGLKGKSLEEFGKNYITQIEDVTPFVTQQKQFLDIRQLDSLLVPIETIYTPTANTLLQRIGIES